MNNKTAPRKPFRFNIIDALFLLVILAATGALVYILFFRGVESTETTANTELEYKVELRMIREELKGKINVGDKVIDAAKLYTIGEVTDVKYATAIYTGVNKAEGALVYSDYTGYVNITITVKAQAEITSNDYMIDGVYKISVGTYVSLRVPNFTGSGYCVSAREVAA